jgi:hypothetical protein
MKKYFEKAIYIISLCALFFACKADFNNTGDPYGSNYNKDKISLLENLSISDGTLMPAFDPNVEEYTAGVSNNIKKISITPAAASKYASVKINNIKVISGEASPSIDLSEGNNPISIVVYAEKSSISTTYTIDLFRAVALPKTGQTSCSYYDDTLSFQWEEDADCSETYSGSSSTRPSGQDGKLQKGAEWPNPRFTDNLNSTVRDNLTGLVWVKTANLFTTNAGWEDVLTFCNDLDNSNPFIEDGSAAGDWRMSNVNELRSLVNYGKTTQGDLWLNYPYNPFGNVSNAAYISSTTNYQNDSQALYVSFGEGITNAAGRFDFDNNIPFQNILFWPVKTGAPGTVKLLKTGLTSCYTNSGTSIECAGTGQDGEYQYGIEPPDPRFVDNVDGTITDRLTGLMWEAAPSETETTWPGALNYADGLTLAGYDDWRLPNVNELSTLQNAGTNDPITWLESRGFDNLQIGYYYSSTSVQGQPYFAWAIEINKNNFTIYCTKDDTANHYAIAVRDAN